MKLTTEQAKTLLDALVKARNTGVIDYNQALVEAKPIMEVLQAKADKIAKKYGKKAPKTSFAYLCRALPNSRVASAGDYFALKGQYGL